MKPPADDLEVMMLLLFEVSVPPQTANQLLLMSMEETHELMFNPLLFHDGVDDELLFKNPLLELIFEVTKSLFLSMVA